LLAGCRSESQPGAVLPPSASAAVTNAPRAGAPASAVSAAPGASAAKSPASVPAGCPDGMVRIPGGKFWVGSGPADHGIPDESPRYQTELAPFCIDATEVTVEAYTRCKESGGCTEPERGRILCNYGRDARADHPVNCVTWTQANAFCRARNARLPTEAEFEYVARGGEQYLKYPWGDASPDDRACWKQPMSCAVKRYPAGAFGLYDVSGNVWEWVDDWYGPYPFPPPDSPWKVYRGGGFSRRFDKWMRTRLRNRSRDRDSGAHLGFRCAANAPGARCPFGSGQEGRCLHGVLAMDCPAGKAFNGVRCALPGEPRCASDRTETPGHGCVAPLDETPAGEDLDALAKSVTRSRSPEFDADCRKNSRDRPQSFRYAGGSHGARNLVSRRSGCKNRDVGVGWNSTCCP
jgi:formylglycine-generating enzyme required for sulfatase activity